MTKLPTLFSVGFTESAPRAQPADLICPDCGAKMVLRETSKFKHKNGMNRKFYGCSNYPTCTATHGAHPNGDPLGIPGNSETKKARIAAHEMFDELWKSGEMSRKGAYRWLAKQLGVEEVHFGEMTKEECEEAMQIIEEEYG